MDLFCGSGGFAQGFLKSDDQYELIYSNDNKKWAIETVKANHPNTLVDDRDIREVDIDGLKKNSILKDVDLIIGGPPCQGFSSLRPNRSKNIEDDRNDLYLYFSKFVDTLRPKYFVMENVVGLITHNKGKTLKLLVLLRSQGCFIE